jgi:PAS domain S-box-containing protein
MVPAKPYTKIWTVYSVAILTAVFFIFLFLYFGVNVRQYIYDDSKEIAKEISRKAANETEEYFRSALMIAYSMGKQLLLVKELKGDRSLVRDIIRGELEKNQNFLGTWTLWEPNAFDDKDYKFIRDTFHNVQGSLGSGFFRYGDSINYEIMTVADYLGPHYLAPKHTLKELVVEPYTWVYTGYSMPFFGTSISIPLIENGNFIGAVGIDIDFKNLRNKLNQIRPYNSGFLSLISSKGVIVSHIDTAILNKNVFDLISINDSVKYSAIIGGQEFTIETVSEFTGKEVFRFFYPINIGYGDPWSMMVEIPIADATSRTNQLIIVASLILFIGLGLIIFQLFNIFDRRRYERTILVAMNEIEERGKIAAVNERNYREIFNSTNEAIFIHNAHNGEVIDVNEVMLQMYGYLSKKEVIGLLISNFSSNQKHNTDERAFEFISKALTEGSQVFEWQAKRKDGHLFWAEVSLRNSQIGGQKRVLAVVRNITERKKIENELRESQQVFETLARMSPVGIFRADLNGSINYINAKGEELVGLPVKDILNDGWLNAIHPENRDNVKKVWEKSVRQGKETSGEYRILKANGSEVWVLANAIPELNGDEIVGFIGTLTDITDLKNAQEKISVSEKKYKDLAEFLPQTIWETDIYGRVKFVNRNGLKILGYSEEELINGFNIINAIAPQDRTKALSNIGKRFMGEPSKGEEYLAIRKDGSTFPVQIFSTAIVEEGKPIGLRGISIDITEIKQAEKELRDSEERYRTIIEAFPDMIMITDADFNIIYGNEVLEQIAGITPEDYRNPMCKVEIHPDDFEQVKSLVLDFLGSNELHSNIIENRFIDRQGNVHWFSGTVSKLSLNNEVYLQTIARDITEKKKNDEELNQYRNNLEMLVKQRTEELESANEELTSINEELYDQRSKLQEALTNLQKTQDQLIQAEKMASLGILASGIAHEINNPLNFIHGGIVGLDRYIQKELPTHIENVEPLVSAIKEGVRRSVDIVKSLNHYTRTDDKIRAGCNINQIICNCLLMLKGQMDGRITVERFFDDEIVNINGNEGKLHQAFLNIIMNAIQAIDGEGIIKIVTRTKETSVEAIITDTGFGISEKNLKQVTDPFFTTKDPGKGTGLGLSITQTIICDHSGTLSIESELGVGTSVTISLPII